MKKTLVALAVLAASGASFAQATISGTVATGFINNLAGTSQGLVSNTAWIGISASEDLGAGTSMSVYFGLNGDGARGAGAYRDDQTMTYKAPAFNVTLASTRSGGNQAGALVAPVSLWDGTFAAQNAEVISRAGIDAVVLNVPVGAVTLTGKYVEGAADGAATPGTTSLVAQASYATGPMKIVGAFTSTTFVTAPVADVITTSWDLHGTYDAGFAKVGLGFDSARRGKASGADTTATFFGVSVPVTKELAMGVNYGKRDVSNFAQFGAQYALSKRTSVNLSAGQVTNAATTKFNEYQLLLAHNF
jgi:hypothetical protein